MGTGHPSFDALSAYHDGETLPTEHAAVAAHLDRCSACRKTLAGFDLLGMALQVDPPAPCADVARFLSAELDGETSPEETALVSAHLTGCTPCRAKRASWQALDLAIAALPGGMPSPVADARIRGLAHRPRRIIPTGPAIGGGVVGRLAAAAIAITLAVIASLPPGIAIAPPAASGEDRPLVASAQQVLNARTNTLYILHATEAYVVAKDATTNVELAHINVGGKPTALALNSFANVVYVLDPSAKSFTTISGDTNTVTATKNVPLAGTITSIQVNQSTGQVVIGASANAEPSASPGGELAIIDPASQKLETRSVDVAPTQVVLDASANRMFLMGANGLTVVDATTYATIAALPVAVAVAASATGGADAILSIDGTRAKLTFYGSTASATFDGTAVNAVGLPDGSFAVLLDINGSGRIQLVDRAGGAIGSLDVVGTAKALTYDPDAKRFLGANGQVVATISGTAIALASPTPSATAQPNPSPSSAPSATPSPSAAVSAPTPSAAPTAAPTPVAPIPGAVLAATGLYRFQLPTGQIPTVVGGSGATLWFVDQNHRLVSIDTRTGLTRVLLALDRDSIISTLVVSDRRIFALDQHTATLYVVDAATAQVVAVGLPFGRSATAMDAAPDGRIWLGSSNPGALLAFDASRGTFDFVPLPAGASVASLSVDLAGRVWFIDAGHGTLDRFDTSQRRITEFTLPATETFTIVKADARGAVWVGGAAGGLYSVQDGVAARSAALAAPLTALTTSSAGRIAFLAVGTVASLYGIPGTVTAVGPGGARSIEADAMGHLWLTDAVSAVFYIAEAQ